MDRSEGSEAVEPSKVGHRRGRPPTPQAKRSRHHPPHSSGPLAHVQDPGRRAWKPVHGRGLVKVRSKSGQSLVNLLAALKPVSQTLHGARTHTCTHTRTHARARARAHTHTHTHTRSTHIDIHEAR